MKVYEALARAFVAEGTSAVFGIMGDANQYWIGSLSGLGVPVYEVRHEGAGLGMADGWARLTGNPGVCTTTSGPGTSQLATAMIVAARARTPLVAFCGDTEWGEVLADQRLDQARFAAGIECGFVRLATPDGALEAVQQAFYTARLESRPVMLSAAIDIQHEDFPGEFDYVCSTDLLTNKPLYPNPEAIATAVEIIKGCERPVIITGRGAVAAGAKDAILRLGEQTGALITTSLLTRNWLANSTEFHAGISGLYATKTTMELLSDCDCVIAIGASLNHYTIEYGLLYPDATFIHINAAPQVVMGDGRSADCYVRSDALLGVNALNDALATQAENKVGYRTTEVRTRLKSALEDPKEFDIEPGTLDPRAVCRYLDEAIPTTMGIIVGTGHHSHFPTMLCIKERPYSVMNKHFACIGQALPTAIGAIIATDNKPALMFEGDAAFMMHVGEFETAVRYDLPLLTIIMNDEGLGMEVQKAKAKGGVDPALGLIRTPDLGAVGTVFGGRGHCVRTMEELRLAVEDFLSDPGPMIIDVRTSKNVVAIPFRRLWYGEETI